MNTILLKEGLKIVGGQAKNFIASEGCKKAAKFAGNLIAEAAAAKFVARFVKEREITKLVYERMDDYELNRAIQAQEEMA